MRDRALTTRALAVSCVVFGIAAQEGGRRDELERATDSLTTIVAGNATKADVFDTNGFHVQASENAQVGADLEADGQRFQLLDLSASGVFRVTVEKGRPMSTGGGVAIFHRDSGRPILSVADSDGDGALDALSYSKVDGAGRVLADVIDYEADGQADMRINFAESYAELWHVDRWYRIENREGRRGITRNGAFVELARDNNRFVVPDR